MNRTRQTLMAGALAAAAFALPAAAQHTTNLKLEVKAET